MRRHKTGRNNQWLLLPALLLLFPLLGHTAAPNIALEDVNGNPGNVNEYIGKGRWVIVVVWSADCHICRRDMYHMTFLQEEQEDKDVSVIGLSIDGRSQREKALAFVDEQSLNFPNFIGNPGDAVRLSGQPLPGTPTYYFFAPNGKFMTLRVGALTQAQAERVVETLKQPP